VITGNEAAGCEGKSIAHGTLTRKKKNAKCSRAEVKTARGRFGRVIRIGWGS
jgi:hypothetical protein